MATGRISRRQTLGGIGGGALTALLAREARAQLRLATSGSRAHERVVLLGTGGGPRPKVERCATAHVLHVNGLSYVVDCGHAAPRQLALAGIPLGSLRHVFITHHHSDHNADYAALLVLAWAAGLRQRVDVWAPPPIARMTQAALDLNAFDIETRIDDEGRSPLAPLIHVHEITQAGLVMQDEHVKVTAALVDHPPIVPSFAFRFDLAARSIVFSGDTARADSVVRLAQGADVLIHEALWVPAIDQIIPPNARAAEMKRHIIQAHTAVDDVGRVATAAGVKTLVLSHLVPAESTLVSDRTWQDAARSQFRGDVVVASDLMEV